MQPMTYPRKDAEAAGRKHYTGATCQKCDNSLRYVSNRECVKCALARNITRKEANKLWRNENKKALKVSRRFSYIKSTYGLSKDQYLEMLAKQNFVCKICNVHNDDAAHGTLCVDHCHSTGKIRGLLCHNCNSAIGLLKESEELLLRSIDYLKGDL